MICRNLPGIALLALLLTPAVPSAGAGSILTPRVMDETGATPAESGSIDLLAGPTETLVIADDTVDAELCGES